MQATRQAMQIASGLGALQFGNLGTSADYVEAGTWEVTALGNLGRDDEALRVGKELLAVGDRILAQRPWYRDVLHAKSVIEIVLSSAADDQLDPRETMRFGLESEQTGLAFLSLDPNNLPARNNLGLAMVCMAESLWAGGRVDESIAWYRKALEPLAEDAHGIFQAQAAFWAAELLHRQAVSGNPRGALLTATSTQQLMARMFGPAPSGSLESFDVKFPSRLAQAEAAYERDDFTTASRLAAEATGQLRAAKYQGESQALLRAYPLYSLSSLYGRAQYHLGHFAAAEQAQRVALQQRKLLSWVDLSVASGQRVLTENSTWLAMALARQGKLREAAQVIDPVVRFDEGLLARNHGDVWVPLELAHALYAQSLADPARSAALRRRAAALLKGLPPRLQKLRDVRQWRRWASEGPPGKSTGRATA